MSATSGSWRESGWQKSSFCATNACVEVKWTGTAVHVRDAGGSVASFSGEEWTAFLAGVRNGEFDAPE